MTALQALASPKFLLADQLSRRFFPWPGAEMDFFSHRQHFFGEGGFGGEVCEFS